MAWRFNILVVANVTADSPELLEALTERAARERCRFTLLVPAPAGGSAGREAAQARLEAGLDQMREAGLEVQGLIGDHDAIAAVHDTWDPKAYDDVVVSTLPTGTSKWLQIDLPHRVRKLTDAPVQHVVAQPPAPEPSVRHGVEPERLGVLTPLSALSGRRPQH
jgi:hypothetical protein